MSLTHNQMLATATPNISFIHPDMNDLIEERTLNLSIGSPSPISTHTCPNIKKTIDRKDTLFQLINPSGSISVGTASTQLHTPILYKRPGKPARNILFDKTSSVVMFKTKDITGPVVARGVKNQTFVYKTHIGQREVTAYAFMYNNPYWYVLMESISEQPLSHSAKYYDGYDNVTKNDLKLAVNHLFTDRTDIDAVYLSPNIIKYVNFYGKQIHAESSTPNMLLEDFRRIVLEWNFDLPPDQLENIFLRKIGHNHENFVLNNRHVFQHLSATTRYKKVQVTSVNEIADIANKTDGENCFVKKETDHFTFFITKNADYYRRQKIDHLFMDGTGSLPAPYSQIINISFYDPLNKRYRFLGCFLLKHDKNWLDHYTWKHIVIALENEVIFKSASVDGERNLVQCLQGQDKKVWGCHFHYSKSIAPFACTIKKKVRVEFYQVAKYFMFTDNPKETFDTLYTLIGSQGERNLYNHIAKTYMNIDYFQYDIPHGSITREIAARFTTSPVEGINNALKRMLKQDRSPLSIYKFIRNMSSKVMNKVKTSSVYQRLDLDEVYRCLQVMKESVNQQGHQTLITKYRCNQRRLLKWQSQKRRDDREYNAQLEVKKKEQRAAMRGKKIEKKKTMNKQGALKVHGLHYKRMYIAFKQLKSNNTALMEKEVEANKILQEEKNNENVEKAYNSLISGLFSLGREVRDSAHMHNK